VNERRGQPARVSHHIQCQGMFMAVWTGQWFFPVATELEKRNKA
jgi:hypothetical protein